MEPEGIRFLHCADIHLDIPFCDNGSRGYSETRRRDVRKTFQGIVNVAREEKLDFALISGDLYEHNYTTRSSAEWIQSLLGSLSVPVVIIPGNHDPYTANSWYRTLEWPQNVIILSDERPSVRFDNLKTFIYGIGFSAFRQDKPDLSRISRPDPDWFNILMLHGTLDMDLGKPYNPVSSADLGSLDYDYYALGHFHNMITDFRLKKAANPGSPEPLGFDEKGGHGIFMVSIERIGSGDKKLTVESRFTAQREYVEPVLDVTGFADIDEIKEGIAGLLEGYDPEKHILKVILKGQTGCPIDCEALEEALSGGRIYLRIRNETRNCRDYEALAAEESLRGAFAREMLARLKSCRENGDAADIPILAAALDLGLEALENGRIDERF